MSYSQAVRTALAAEDPARDCCQAALLDALVKLAAKSQPGGLRLYLETPAVARQAFRLAKAHWHALVQLERRGHPSRLLVRLPDDQAPALPASGLSSDCCRRAWLRGAFLAGGSLTRPEQSYHLEFAVTDQTGGMIIDLLAEEGIRARRDSRRVYLKAGEEIRDYLSLIGASTAYENLEQLLEGRGLKNQVQRAVNCETANLGRMAEAAQRQADAIRELQKQGSLELLSADLQCTAKLRLLNPFASLAELARLHDPPVSKSAINHRMRALLKRPVQAAHYGGQGC